MTRTSIFIATVALSFSCSVEAFPEFGPKVAQVTASGDVVFVNGFGNVSFDRGSNVYTLTFSPELTKDAACYAFASPAKDSYGDKLIATPTVPSRSKVSVDVRPSGRGAGDPLQIPSARAAGFVIACVTADPPMIL